MTTAGALREMAIGYVCNRYPTVSNKFILLEIEALRALGLPIETFSVRRPGPDDLLAAADRAEHDRTFYLLPPSPRALLRAHLLGLLARPRRYFGTLKLAWSLAAPGARAHLWQILYFGEAILLWDLCRRRGVRHLHAHLAYVASDDALLAAHMGGWTWSFTMHGPPEFYDVPGTRLAQKAASANAVVCITDFTRSQLMGLIDEQSWSKLHLVRSGMRPGFFANTGSRNGATADGVEVLAVGRLVAVKGHAVLLRALAELDRRGLNVRATIVGEGPERAALERCAHRLEIEDRVRLAGAIGHDDIRAFYEQADILCQPSFAEGLPMVLMEAMAMELPVVATRVMGIPELVEDGVTGLLVAPGRADELADAVARLAQDPQLRASLGRAGRERVLVQHELDDVSRQLVDMYRQLGAAA